MREIKFRAWCEKENVMECFDLQDIKYYMDVPLMQYIGLLDKNGVEIYEGDIVRHNEGQVYPIIFSSAKFGVDYQGSAVPPHDGQSWEVIGNIHENPELLEDK